MRLSVGGISHTVVQLVARVQIKLEVGAHWRLNCGVQSLLKLLSHVLIVIACAKLLVKLFVLLWSIKTLHWLSGCSSSTLSSTSLATINISAMFSS